MSYFGILFWPDSGKLFFMQTSARQVKTEMLLTRCLFYSSKMGLRGAVDLTFPRCCVKIRARPFPYLWPFHPSCEDVRWLHRKCLERWAHEEIWRQEPNLGCSFVFGEYMCLPWWRHLRLFANSNASRDFSSWMQVGQFFIRISLWTLGKITAKQFVHLPNSDGMRLAANR